MTAPDAVTLRRAEAGNASVTLRFGPEDNGGSPFTKHWYRSKTAGAAWGDWTDLARSGETDTGWTGAAELAAAVGLANGTAYALQIRAVNAVGNGAASNTLAATPRASTPRNEVWSGTFVSDDTNVTRSGGPGEATCAAVFETASFTIDGVHHDVEQVVFNQGEDKLSLNGESRLRRRGDPGPADAARRRRRLRAEHAHGAGRDAVDRIHDHYPGGRPYLLRLTRAQERPSAPRSLTAAAGDDYVDLGWTASADHAGTIEKHQGVPRSLERGVRGRGVGGHPGADSAHGEANATSWRKGRRATARH